MRKGTGKGNGGKEHRRDACATGIAMGTGRDAAIARAVSGWFRGAARALPWRTAVRDPYHALVAESMLQQTQVSRVVEKFGQFVGRFPTVEALAGTSEDEVLAMWSGLGYYRRARNLHAAARAVVERFGGRVPDRVEDLLTLPGVGRYTAGAIASIAHGRVAPIVDGNVARVILRIDAPPGAEKTDPQDPGVVKGLWRRAEELVASAEEPGAFNEGLMELGATVCFPLPRPPACERCPAAPHCRARELGMQMRIPRAKTAAKRRPLYASSVVVRDAAGAVLVERRPSEGLWGGLWQAPTVERDDRPATGEELEAAVGVRGLALATRFEFRTTHRDVWFEVWEAEGVRGEGGPARGEFLARERVAGLGLSNPQRRILLGEERGDAADGQDRLF